MRYLLLLTFVCCGLILQNCSSSDDSISVNKFTIDEIEAIEFDSVLVHAYGENIAELSLQTDSLNYGIEWDIDEAFQNAVEIRVELEAVADSFIVGIGSLPRNVPIYFRAYLLDGINKKFSNVLSQSLLLNVEGAAVTDYDGNEYPTVIIGNQQWMSTNLRTTHFADGRAIEFNNLERDTEWINSSSPLYSYYNDDTDLSNSYGFLYNGYVLNKTLVLEEGWRVPTYDDWNKLIMYCGGYLNAVEYLEDETVWSAKNGAFPGISLNRVGARIHLTDESEETKYLFFNERGLYWTNSPSTDYTSSRYFYLNMTKNNISMYPTITFSCGLPIRLVKDVDQD